MDKIILIVEDDKNIIEGLEDILSVNGYKVFSAMNSEQALMKITTEMINLIIIDVNLGSDNGFDLCKMIRKKSNIPILFLTACDSEMELIRGFQAGGDDYITKPFRMQELLVRIQALLRRCVWENAAYIRSGDIIFSNEECRISKNGLQIYLTSTEFKIVSILINKWPNIIERDELYYQVWDRNSEFVEANTLNVNISRIRDKLGNYQNTNYIETVRGIGYRWGVPVKRQIYGTDIGNSSIDCCYAICN